MGDGLPARAFPLNFDTHVQVLGLRAEIVDCPVSYIPRAETTMAVLPTRIEIVGSFIH